MPIIKNYQSIIDEFTKNSSKIKFISHLAAKSLAISNTSDDYNKHNVLFLDSSFNPPHKGHISIIENAINHYQKKCAWAAQILTQLCYCYLSTMLTRSIQNQNCLISDCK